jgi:LCP family protein required for cell wall assembly
MNRDDLKPNDEQKMDPSLEDQRLEIQVSTKRKPLTKKAKIWIVVATAIILLFFTPWRVNILLLGIDPSHDETANSRTDTMILTSIPPVLPMTHMLSIPRDLYMDIPGHGQNRINTAHFFAELENPGSGPKAAAKAVALNFHVATPYTVRIKLSGFADVVDAMGGVDLILTEELYGLEPGMHHLDSAHALKFIRDRSESDDFSRQKRAQAFLQSATKQMLNPINWWRIPAVANAFFKSVDINIPVVYWPRVGYSFLFSAVRGWDMHILDRSTMVTPWTTEEGGQVLLPNWETIDPLIEKYFK